VVPLWVVVIVISDTVTLDDVLDEVELLVLLEEVELLVLLEELVEDALDDVELVDPLEEVEVVELELDELVVIVAGIANHWIFIETGNGVA
jgi:hypothetical protein